MRTRWGLLGLLALAPTNATSDDTDAAPLVIISAVPSSFPLVCANSMTDPITLTAKPAPQPGKTVRLSWSDARGLFATEPKGPFTFNHTNPTVTFRGVAHGLTGQSINDIHWETAEAGSSANLNGLQTMQVSDQWRYKLTWPLTLAYGDIADKTASLLACGGEGSWVFNPLFDLDVHRATLLDSPSAATKACSGHGR